MNIRCGQLAVYVDGRKDRGVGCLDERQWVVELLARTKVAVDGVVGADARNGRCDSPERRPKRLQGTKARRAGEFCKPRLRTYERDGRRGTTVKGHGVSKGAALRGRGSQGQGMYLRQGRAGGGGERKVCRMKHYCGRAYLVGLS